MVTQGGGTAKVGDTVKINGVESSTTTASQTFTVETGLDTIHNFVIMAEPTGVSYLCGTYAIYQDSDTNKYFTAYHTTAVAGGWTTLGSSVSISNITIVSVNGGTVTLSTGSDTQFGALKNIKWFAN